MTHIHAPKIVEWGLDNNTNYVAKLYGCLHCDETFAELPEAATDDPSHEHTSFVPGSE